MLESRAVYNGVPDGHGNSRNGDAESRSFTSVFLQGESIWKRIVFNSGRSKLSLCHEQSSLGSYELVDDFSNASREANIVNPSNRSSASPSIPNKGSPSQSQLTQELAITEDVEDNPSETSQTQWRDNQRNQNARASSSSFSSGSSWERFSGQSQSGIETEEDVADPSHDGNDASVGCTKAGSISSFSLSDSSASSSSWQKFPISPR